MNSYRSLKLNLTSAAVVFAALSLSAGASFAQQLPAIPPAGTAVQEEAPSLPALPEGATIEGAREKITNKASEAGKSLERLMGGAVTSRTEAEVGSMAERKRSIMMLELQRDEAKLAKELYYELEGGKEEQEVTRLREENEVLKTSLEAAQKAPPPPTNSIPVSPVVTEIIGAAGGMKASISYPGSGAIQASPGTILPNGWKVVSVSSSGVVVLDGESRKTLGFGAGF